MIVPLSAVVAEGGNLCPRHYMQDPEDEGRRTAARKKIKEGVTGIIGVAKRRREVRELQRRHNIKEIEV
jgi:hypothetical protein